MRLSSSPARRPQSASRSTLHSVVACCRIRLRPTRGKDMLAILKEYGAAGAIGLLVGLVLLAIIGPRTSGGAVLIMMVPVLVAIVVWSVINAIRNRVSK